MCDVTLMPSAAVSDGNKMLDNLAIIHEAFPRTVRLVSTARLRAPVLEMLVDADEINALAELEGATSRRQTAQLHGTGNLTAGELVHGVPHAHFINASFAYARPDVLNRFNGPDRGAWYAALAAETGVHEVGFHLTQELINVGRLTTFVDFAEMFADFIGGFLDLRPHPDAQCLHPDKNIGYPAGNLMADNVRAAGLNGIVYPSVRHAGGTCFAILLPHAVQNVTQGSVWRLTWAGSPDFSFSQVLGAA